MNQPSLDGSLPGVQPSMSRKARNTSQPRMVCSSLSKRSLVIFSLAGELFPQRVILVMELDHSQQVSVIRELGCKSPGQ